MAERLTQPNTRNPAGRIIDIDGVGRVEVGPEFFDLPPEQQEQVVAEIVADYGGGQQGGPPPAGQPAQEPLSDQFVPEEQRRVPEWLTRVAPYGSLVINEAINQGVGIAQGVAEIGDRAANLAEGAYNSTVGALIGHESRSADTPAFAPAAQELGYGGEPGRAAGRIAGTALLTRGMGGAVAQGAGAGALMSDAETPGEFALDVAEGGAGGFIGDRIIRGARGVLDPAIERGARLLRQGGTRLTPGQALPALREFEDKSMSLPFAGPQLTRARQQGFEDFAVSIPRQSLQTAQARLPNRVIPDIPEGANGQEAVRHTGDQLSAIYEDIYPNLRLGADEELITGIRNVASRLEDMELSDAGRSQFERIVRRGITGRFRGDVATGREYQAADDYLEQQINGYSGPASTRDDRMIAEGLQDIRATLRNGLVRQNGRLGEELEAVDEAWSMLVPAEAAAANAPRGFFSPAQYRQQLKRGDSRVRRRGMARGEVRGQEYAEAGQDILPSESPNFSGTAGHEAYNFGNARFYQGLATRMFYNPTTQNFLMRATVDRPAALDPLARGAANALNLVPAPQAGASLLGGSTNSLFGY